MESCTRDSGDDLWHWVREWNAVDAAVANHWQGRNDDSQANVVSPGPSVI